LHASGYRTNSNVAGHHAKTVQSLEHTIGADAALVRKFDAFRRKRNRISYDKPLPVSDQEAADMLALAEKLRRDVEARIREKTPDADIDDEPNHPRWCRTARGRFPGDPRFRNPSAPSQTPV